MQGQGGQAEYKIELYDLTFSVNAGVKNSTSSHLLIEAVYDDTTTEELYYRHLGNNGDKENNWILSPPITSTKLPIKVHTEGFVNFRTGTDAHYDQYDAISMCSENSYNVSSNSPRMSSITYKVRVTPIHTLTTEINSITGLVNTNLPSEDKVNLYAKQGFDSSLYNYQYSLDNVTWVDIDSSLYTLETLSVSAKDLFGANYTQYVGQNIYFRVVSCLENGTYQSWSDPVVLTIMQSSPHILSSTISPTKCSDTEDGTATLNFDRALLSGETLEISLVNTDTGAAVLNQDITDELQTVSTYILEGLAPGNYKLDLLGTYGGNATYTDSDTHTISFEITKPTPVTFDLTSKTDIYCFEGSDGVITLTAGGGQDQYQYQLTKDGQDYLDWTDFTNGYNTIIQNLSVGVYRIKVRDSNFCLAKESGSEKEVTVTLTQPSAPIELTETEIVIPTGYGLSNGYISVRVIGGTSYADNTYDYEWRKDSPTGAVISTGITTDATNNPFTIKLDGLTAGNYYLTVKDKNYSSASSALGACGIISEEYIVTQPEPLVASIDVQQQISCNIANDYAYKLDLNGNGIPDETEDGSLQTTVTGGVGTYTYQWQKLSGGVFQNLSGETGSTLSNQSVGSYKILVTDANNNSTEAEYTFVYPATLEISLTGNDIACSDLSSGVVSVTATGGTGAYSYEWSTMDTTPTVTGLSGGSYFVLVTDSKNCKVKGTTEVTQPDQIVITDVLVQNPICYGASNGVIQTSISGGSTPYTAQWSNGATGETLTSVPSGTYTLTVTDANGCGLYKEYTLTDPDARTVDLGNDVTLCLGDTQTYDVSIDDSGATYLWTDQTGKTVGQSGTITLSDAGTYTVLITDSNGCTATDSVTIKNSSEVLDPQFALTTHAYTESSVILVNTSPTTPESVEWIILDNSNIQVINEDDNYLELKFSAVGSYEIGLRGTQGDCVKTVYKEVVVEYNTSGTNLEPSKATNITEFTIVPNPNNGTFQAIVGLSEEKTIKIRIIDMVSHEVYPAVTKSGLTYFSVPYNTSLPAGTYLIILETGDEVLVKRMLVQ